MGILIALHVLSAFLLAGGILGRNAVLWQAARATDVRAAAALVNASGIIERLTIIPGSFAVLIFGLLATWSAHIPPLGFLQGAPTNWLLISLVLYISVMALVPILFIPRGKIFDAALQEAEAKGEVTPALRTAFADPAVMAARTYETFAIVLVIILMVTRPF